MEPLELRRAKILRERIAALQAELEGKAERGPEASTRLEELQSLKTQYLRALARLADLDYRRRRETWRSSPASPLRACC